MTRPVASFAGPVLAMLLTLVSAARAGEPLDEARASLNKGDSRAAVERIELALPDANADRLPALLEFLREAYPKAAEKADSENRPRDAHHYREALELIGSADKPEPDDAPRPEPVPVAPTATIPRADPPEPTAEEPRVDHLRLADQAWQAKKYHDAGEHYAALAKVEKLPPARRDHWAYCRLVDLLERINAGPSSPTEWAEVHAEIDHIRVLSPKNWYSEYLRNVVVERSGVARRPKGDPLVVRGAAPEENTPNPRKQKARSNPSTRPAATLPAPVDVLPAEPTAEPIQAAPMPQPQPEREIGRVGPAQGNWRTYVTPNFRIFHNDDALARKVAAKAEATRREAAKRWTGIEPAVSWTPKCDLYLYPTAAIFAEQTDQPAASPGFSTAGLEGGRVTARMVRLRVDYPKMLDAALPHEVTHIVLADLFPAKQIPRWADEGMAVLSEPATEQSLRLRDLAGPVQENVLFRLDVLMSSDYPNGSHWALFYAQSVSVTRYLVGLGTPPQFVRFVRMTQQQGADVALKTVYNIDGVAQLEQRWKTHARESVNPITAEGDSAIKR